MSEYIDQHKIACLLSAALLITPAAAFAAGTGTIQGTVTTQGGALLNGVCGHLIDAKYTKDITDFAGTGTDGQSGSYIQANIAPDRYIILFTDCGANVAGGSPDPNYVPVFYGGGVIPSKALRVSVIANTTTTLNPQPMTLGGTVTGTVTDSTTKKPAEGIAVAAVFPGDAAFNVKSPLSWQIVCADASGTYSVSGVPASGVKIYFAPNNWGCFNSGGTYTGGFWVQKILPGLIAPPEDGTLANVSGSVKETPIAASAGLAGLTVVPAGQ